MINRMATTDAKLRFISRLCKLGAWIIGVLGAGTSIFFVTTVFPAFSAFKQTLNGNAIIYIAYANLIYTFFLITIPTVFFVVVLYALAILLEHFLEKTSRIQPVATEPSMEDGALEISPLPDTIER